MWTPADWILWGAYCPRSDIAAQLDQIRLESKCSILVHFGIDDDAILRTLTFVSTEREPLRSVEADIRAYLGHNSRRDRLHESLRYIVQQQAKGSSVGTTLETIAADLRTITLLRDLNAVWLVHEGITGVPVRSILLALDEEPARIESDLLHSLAVAINATPSAEARRDTRAMEQVAGLPTSSFSIPAADRVAGDFMAAALDLAMTVTKSGSGALYLRDALTPSTSELVAVREPVDGITYPDAVQPLEPLDRHLLDVLDRQRFIHRESGAIFRSMPSETSPAELLCPLPWTSATPGPAAGFIVLHKSPTSGSFSAYDRALVRNVSLRVGLHRYAESATAIGAAIADLRRGLRNSAPPDAVSLVPSRLPLDIESALPRILGSLPKLGRATDSHSVSLRIILPSAGNAHDGHRTLTQVAIYPPEARREELHDLPPDEGANWTVVRTGQVVLHDDTDTAANYTSTRESTRSEVSVPVRSEGRIVGTLNLESPYVGNYRALAALVEAFGSAVGRVLADTATNHARASLSRSIAVEGKSHDLRKSVDEALAALNTVQGPETATVRKQLQRAGAIIDQIRSMAEDHGSYDSTIADIIYGVITEADMPTLRHAIDWKAEIRQSPVPSYQAYILRPVLLQLLANLKDHGASYISAADQPRIKIRTTEFDGFRNAVVVFDNRADLELDPAVVVNPARIWTVR